MTKDSSINPLELLLQIDRRLGDINKMTQGELFELLQAWTIRNINDFFQFRFGELYSEHTKRTGISSESFTLRVESKGRLQPTDKTLGMLPPVVYVAIDKEKGDFEYVNRTRYEPDFLIDCEHNLSEELCWINKVSGTNQTIESILDDRIWNAFSLETSLAALLQKEFVLLEYVLMSPSGEEAVHSMRMKLMDEMQKHEMKLTQLHLLNAPNAVIGRETKRAVFLSSAYHRVRQAWQTELGRRNSRTYLK